MRLCQIMSDSRVGWVVILMWTGVVWILGPGPLLFAAIGCCCCDFQFTDPASKSLYVGVIDVIGT